MQNNEGCTTFEPNAFGFTQKRIIDELLFEMADPEAENPE